MTIQNAATSRVLIVEDEAPIRQFMIEVLSRFGFTPVPASDAAEALQILDRDTIDLVLLDLHMPGPAGRRRLALSIAGPWGQHTDHHRLSLGRR